MHCVPGTGAAQPSLKKAAISIFRSSKMSSCNGWFDVWEIDGFLWERGSKMQMERLRRIDIRSLRWKSFRETLRKIPSAGSVCEFPIGKKLIITTHSGKRALWNHSNMWLENFWAMHNSHPVKTKPLRKLARRNFKTSTKVRSKVRLIFVSCYMGRVLY